MSNTLAYAGGVWVSGFSDWNGRTMTCEGPTGLKRFWPGRDSEAIPHTCSQFEFQFGARADLLYYLESGEGIFRRLDASTSEAVPTPPCFLRPESYAIDDAGIVYYTCRDTLRRGNGELIRTGIGDVLIKAVLSSGRVVVFSPSIGNYGLLDVDGTELSHAPIEGWVGRFDSGDGGPVTRSGDSAFVTLGRTYRDSTRREVVVFRVDGASNTWRKVRRLPSDGYRAHLALPDGTVLETRHEWAITVFPPDAPPRILTPGTAPEIEWESLRDPLIPGP